MVEEAKKKKFESIASISYGFDLWTDAADIPYLGITYQYLDESFIVRADLLDFVPVREKHTARNLACHVAASIEARLKEKIVIGYQTVDSGRNVVAAAKMVYKLIGREKDDDIELDVNANASSTSISLPLPQDYISYARSFGAQDSDNVRARALDMFEDDCEKLNHLFGAEADIDDENEREEIDELNEEAKHVTLVCISHAFNTAQREAAKCHPNVLKPLVKLLNINAAVCMSPKIQAELKRIHNVFGTAVKKLHRMCLTRFNTLLHVVRAFVHNIAAIRVAAAQEYFDDLYRGEIDVPTDGDVVFYNALIKILELVEVRSVFFQGSNYCAIAHVPHLLSTLRERLEAADDDNLSEKLKVFRKALLQEIQKRTNSYLDSSSAALMAAWAHPSYMRVLQKYIVADTDEDKEAIEEKVSDDIEMWVGSLFDLFFEEEDDSEEESGATIELAEKVKVSKRALQRMSLPQAKRSKRARQKNNNNNNNNNNSNNDALDPDEQRKRIISDVMIAWDLILTNFKAEIPKVIGEIIDEKFVGKIQHYDIDKELREFYSDESIRTKVKHCTVHSGDAPGEVAFKKRMAVNDNFDKVILLIQETAKLIFSAMPSSADSERVFFMAKIVKTKLHYHLDERKFQKLLKIKYFLKNASDKERNDLESRLSLYQDDPITFNTIRAQIGK